MTNTSTPKYKVTVGIDFDGPDGNAFAIMAKVKRALQNAGASKEEITQYTMDSMSGDYDNLVATTRKWVTVRHL